MLIIPDNALTICHLQALNASKKQFSTPQIKIKEINYPNFPTLFF